LIQYLQFHKVWIFIQQLIHLKKYQKLGNYCWLCVILESIDMNSKAAMKFSFFSLSFLDFFVSPSIFFLSSFSLFFLMLIMIIEHIGWYETRLKGFCNLPECYSREIGINYDWDQLKGLCNPLDSITSLIEQLEVQLSKNYGRISNNLIHTVMNSFSLCTVTWNSPLIHN
jgi:hypothetical protein